MKIESLLEKSIFEFHDKFASILESENRRRAHIQQLTKQIKSSQQGLFPNQHHPVNRTNTIVRRITTKQR